MKTRNDTSFVSENERNKLNATAEPTLDTSM